MTRPSSPSSSQINHLSAGSQRSQPRTVLRRGRLRRAPSSRAIATVAFAGYLAFALFVTWPWITDPSGILYGVIGGDLTSGVASFQQFAEERQPPFLPGEIRQINAPEGVPTDWAVHLASVGSSGVLWLLSIAIGSIAAHGVVALLGFTLSAFAMFLLVREVTGHPGVAFVIGLAFGFWPFMYGTGWTWPQYIHLWVFVLLVWRALVATEKPTLFNGFLLGAAAVVAMTWIQYNLLIAGVTYATLAAVALARSVARGELKAQLATQAFAGAVVGVAIAGLLAAAVASDYRGVPVRSAQQAVTGSARLEMYVVPGPRHPLFGSRTAPWLFNRFSGAEPNPPPDRAIYAEIYLGIPLLLLALMGAAWTLVTVFRQAGAALRSGPASVGITALVVGFVTLVFSGPPRVTVAGLVIPMPYALLENVTTVFRVPHRFAVVVMLSVCLLAALALTALLRHRPLALQVGALALLAVVFAVDLRAQPSPSTTEVQYPPIYDLLKRQPPGIVAEYPLNLAPTVGSLQSFYQEAHEHALFAGAPTGSEDESRKLELQFLLAQRTVPDLAAYGVDYVIAYHPDPPTPPRPGQPIPGLRLIGGDANATLYRVLARPSTFTSYGIRGFYVTEGPAPGMRWTAQNGAELELIGRCSPCVGTISFPAAAFALPRMLTIKDERGRAVFTGRIDVTADRVRFRIRFSRRTVLRLRTDPPPIPINSVIPGPDTRTVSILIGQPVVFVPDPRRGHRPIS
jgi:hypothetical protein